MLFRLLFLLPIRSSNIQQKQSFTSCPSMLIRLASVFLLLTAKLSFPREPSRQAISLTQTSTITSFATPLPLIQTVLFQQNHSICILGNHCRNYHQHGHLSSVFSLCVRSLSYWPPWSWWILLFLMQVHSLSAIPLHTSTFFKLYQSLPASVPSWERIRSTIHILRRLKHRWRSYLHLKVLSKFWY